MHLPAHSKTELVGIFRTCFKALPIGWSGFSFRHSRVPQLIWSSKSTMIGGSARCPQIHSSLDGRTQLYCNRVYFLTLGKANLASHASRVPG